MQSIEQFYPLLQKPFKAIITAHQKPDGDAMGSSLALYHFLIQLGHDVTVVSPTNWAPFLIGCQVLIKWLIMRGIDQKQLNWFNQQIIYFV